MSVDDFQHALIGMLNSLLQETSPKAIPTAKWHDMPSTINVSKKWKHNVGNDDPSDSLQDIEDDFASKEPDKLDMLDSNVNSNNTGDKDKEAHSDEDEIADEKADDTSWASANEDSFNIKDTIDINNLDLHNALSDKPIVISKPITQQKQVRSLGSQIGYLDSRKPVNWLYTQFYIVCTLFEYSFNCQKPSFLSYGPWSRTRSMTGI